jgi:hypothetical protein
MRQCQMREFLASAGRDFVIQFFALDEKIGAKWR